MQSALTLRRALVNGEVRPPEIPMETWQRLKERLPGKGKWGVLVALRLEEETWYGMVRDEQGKERAVNYSPALGLTVELNNRQG